MTKSSSMFFYKNCCPILLKRRNLKNSFNKLRDTETFNTSIIISNRPQYVPKIHKQGPLNTPYISNCHVGKGQGFRPDDRTRLRLRLNRPQTSARAPAMCAAGHLIRHRVAPASYAALTFTLNTPCVHENYFRVARPP